VLSFWTSEVVLQQKPAGYINLKLPSVLADITKNSHNTGQAADYIVDCLPYEAS